MSRNPLYLYQHIVIISSTSLETLQRIQKSSPSGLHPKKYQRVFLLVAYRCNPIVYLIRRSDHRLPVMVVYETVS